MRPGQDAAVGIGATVVDERVGPVPLTLLRRRPQPIKQPLACVLPEAVSGGLVPSRFNLGVWDGQAVYNTSTGNYIVLTSDERRILDAALAGRPVETADAPRLYETGLLIDPGIDEVSAIRMAFQVATASRYSPHLTIAPTMDCNFGCAYCFESHTRGGMPGPVQDGLVSFVEDLLGDAGADPQLSVTWFGGEPLMAMDVIEALTERFRAMVESGRARAYSADIITNGFGLSASVRERLRRVGIHQIQITIDGPAAMHDARRNLKASGAGTYARIIANIRHAVEHFRVVVRVNVDRTNADTVKDLLTDVDRARLLPAVLVDPARVEAFSVDGRSAALLTAAEFTVWRSQLRAWASERGWHLSLPPANPSMTGVCQVDSLNSFVVDPRGQLYKCWAELGTTAPPVGQLTDPSTWPRHRVGALAQRDPFDDPGCVTCLLLPMCLGGCPKTREVGRATGSPECPPFRHNITELVQARHGSKTVIVNQIAIA